MDCWPRVWSRHATAELAHRARRFQPPDEAGGLLWRVCFMLGEDYPWALVQYPTRMRQEAGMADRPQLPVGPIRDLVAKCSEASRDEGQGMSYHELAERTGQPWNVVRFRCESLIDQGLLERLPGAVVRVGATEKGRALL